MFLFIFLCPLPTLRALSPPLCLIYQDVSSAEGGENSAARVSAFTAVQVMNERLRKREVCVCVWGFMAVNASIHSSPQLLRVPQGRRASPRFHLRGVPDGVRGPSGDDAQGRGFFLSLSPLTRSSFGVGELAGK